MTSPLRYRGVSYDPASHEHASEQPVTHTYRGHAYLTPLYHPAADVESNEELRYRGRPYRSHRGQGRGC
jgi:hypothetical protein